MVVRVSDTRVEAIHARIERMTTGFAGKLVLLGDDELADTDCSVVWADGGCDRELGRLWRDIETVAGRLTDDHSTPRRRSPLDDLFEVGDLASEADAAPEAEVAIPAEAPATDDAQPEAHEDSAREETPAATAPDDPDEAPFERTPPGVERPSMTIPEPAN